MKSIRRVSILLIALNLIFTFSLRAAAGEDQVREYIAQCLAQIEQNNYTKALDCLEAALALQDSNPELYRLQGQVLEILERPQEAITAWENCRKFATDPALREEANHHIENLSSD
ncbi:MAG: tetratricopeptide repeat protein [Candidatus Neomarinimicrobiota bacterium]